MTFSLKPLQNCCPSSNGIDRVKKAANYREARNYLRLHPVKEALAASRRRFFEAYVARRRSHERLKIFWHNWHSKHTG